MPVHGTFAAYQSFHTSSRSILRASPCTSLVMLYLQQPHLLVGKVGHQQYKTLIDAILDEETISGNANNTLGQFLTEKLEESALLVTLFQMCSVVRLERILKDVVNRAVKKAAHPDFNILYASAPIKLRCKQFQIVPNSPK
ncbi:hypothetical protein F5887DRAFT_919169 [Amanita rubescens]|nr:hypothetical protein F5887DRAFT_919169 [Amanita rubescens]